MKITRVELHSKYKPHKNMLDIGSCRTALKKGRMESILCENATEFGHNFPTFKSEKCG